MLDGRRRGRARPRRSALEVRQPGARHASAASSPIAVGEAPRRRPRGRARRRSARPSASARADGVEALGDELAVGLDVARDVGERARVAGQREPRVERVDDVERVQELADRVGRVADVEVLRDAARAGGRRRSAAAARAGAGRRATARGRASRSPARCRGRSRPSTPGTRSRSACSVPAWPRARAAALLGPAPQRLLRHAALAARPRSSRSSAARGPRRRAACQVRVHPDLAAGALGDRRRLAAVVDVRVGDDDQPDVARARRPTCVERALEVPIEPRLVHAGVDEHDPVAGRSAHALQCGTPGQGSGSRSRQTPGQHPLAAADLAGAGGLAHGAARYRGAAMAAVDVVNADVGEQYRSVAFYRDDAQKAAIERAIQRPRSQEWNGTIVTRSRAVLGVLQGRELSSGVLQAARRESVLLARHRAEGGQVPQGVPRLSEIGLLKRFFADGGHRPGRASRRANVPRSDPNTA